MSSPPPEIGAIFACVWAALLAGIFAWLRDERPRRGEISELQRAAHWLYERLFLAALLSGLVAALLVFGPYALVEWLG